MDTVLDPTLIAEPADVGLSADALRRVDETVSQLVDAREISGAVTMVARHGKVAHFSANGLADVRAATPMRRDTIFRIYSMTKPIGAVATMMLVERGRLELDAPVGDYLPDLRGLQVVVDPDAAALVLENARREMTVRDLLRHTSGLPGSAIYIAGSTALGDLYRAAGMDHLHECDLQELVRILGTVPLVYQPGTRWMYAISAEVTGRLVEVASGQRFDAFLTQNIFEPLQMVDTGFCVPPEKLGRFAAMHGPDGAGGVTTTLAPQGGSTHTAADNFRVMPKLLSNGGGLVSTASDFMRFCLLLTGKGQLGGVRLLKPETVEMMTANQLPDALIPIDKTPRERYDGLGFGLGFSVRVYETGWVPEAQVGEYGWIGGASTEFWISPREQLIALVLLQHIPFAKLSRAVKPHVYRAVVR